MSVISQTEDHSEGVYQVLRYLERNPGRGQLFRKQSTRNIKIYGDADWAGSYILISVGNLLPIKENSVYNCNYLVHVYPRLCGI